MSDLVGRTLKASTKSITVEEEALVFSYRALYHGFKGDKRIPYRNITAVQFKEPGGWIAGYIQFSIQGAIEWQGQVNQDENAAQYDKENVNEFRALRDFVQEKMRPAGDYKPSMADEIAKLADLRDRGIITEEEFSSGKSKLLTR